MSAKKMCFVCLLYLRLIVYAATLELRIVYAIKLVSMSKS